MKVERPKTADEIFKNMHRELRAWNSDIPESPDRMDPVLRIMLKLYSSQLESIDRKIADTWTLASNALVKSLYPENIRWPVPAFTVMQAQPSDPVIHVDPRTQFFYKEEREGGQTFFFSPLRKERLVQATLQYVFFSAGGHLYDLSPLRPDSTQIASRIQPSSFSGRDAVLYAAVTHNGAAEDFDGCIVYLQGGEEALKQLRWAKWMPCIDGSFYEDGSFCPGSSGTIDEIFSTGGETIDWGGLRQSSDLFKPVENSFFVIPGRFATAWRQGSPDAAFLAAASSGGIEMPPDSEGMYWIKIVLPQGGDRSVFQTSFRMQFDCFIAVNKYERTLFKHTGGNKLIEIQIPDTLDSILEVTSVLDSNGRDYFSWHEAMEGEGQRVYTLLEQDGKLVLWFDFSSELEFPPDSITVNYSVTTGTEANGISAGKVTELYENHPGIISLRNITPVSGAIPAKTEQQIVTEISARLRGRDRAMSFDQLVSWARTFDDRVKKVECEKGVMRTDRGVCKCIVVKITVEGRDFYSDEEIELLRTRLGSFLKSRSSINSRFRLEIVRI